MAEQYLSKTAIDLAHFIAGECADDAMFGQAIIVAECELTLQRIRQARVAAIESAGASNGARTEEATKTANAFLRALPTLSRIDRYERRAYSRHKKALQTLNDLQTMAQLRRELGSA